MCDDTRTRASEPSPRSVVVRRWQVLDRGWQATVLGLGIVALTALADALPAVPV
jgi:hypothetical protein